MRGANAVQLAGRTGFEQYRSIAINPWTVCACVVAGATFGAFVPQVGGTFSAVGRIYIDFQRMVVLPFMVASIVFSLQRLLRDGGGGNVLWRVIVVFSIFSVAVAILAALAASLADFGKLISDDTRAALGDLISASDDHNNMSMLLLTPEAPPKRESMVEFLETLAPSNVFAALANGEMLRVLVFALFFGAAVSKVPASVAGPLIQMLDTVYRACQVLMRWITLPLPFALFIIAAGEAAAHGFEPIKAMRPFVLCFLAATVAFIAVSLAIMSFRSGKSIGAVGSAMRESFGLGVATNNSAVCMPSMIDGLAVQLGFSRARMELLVPIVIALMRTGATTYFIFATFFVAALYGRSVSVMEGSMIVITSVLAGIASTGAAGVATLSLLTITTGPLGLPFEAAYVLFVTVDSVCSVMRTVTTVIAGAAAVSLICERPSSASAAAAKSLETLDRNPVVASSA